MMLEDLGVVHHCQGLEVPPSPCFVYVLIQEPPPLLFREPLRVSLRRGVGAAEDALVDVVAELVKQDVVEEEISQARVLHDMRIQSESSAQRDQ